MQMKIVARDGLEGRGSSHNLTMASRIETFGLVNSSSTGKEENYFYEQLP